MATPLISGTVKLSSSGIGRSSTTAAIPAPVMRIQSSMEFERASMIAAMIAETRKNPSEPNGDLFNHRGLLKRLPIIDAVGSPIERNSKLATAMISLKRRKHNRAEIIM